MCCSNYFHIREEPYARVNTGIFTNVPRASERRTTNASSVPLLIAKSPMAKRVWFRYTPNAALARGEALPRQRSYLAQQLKLTVGRLAHVRLDVSSKGVVRLRIGVADATTMTTGMAGMAAATAARFKIKRCFDIARCSMCSSVVAARMLLKPSHDALCFGTLRCEADSSKLPRVLMSRSAPAWCDVLTYPPVFQFRGGRASWPIIDGLPSNGCLRGGNS